MRILLSILLAALTAGLFSAATPLPAGKATGIEFFSGTLQQAQEKAKNEKKLLFIDVNTSWCHWCKKLKSETFPNKKVGEYFNRNFINLSVDAEKEGRELARKYHINAFPTLVFMNAEGRTIMFAEGFYDAAGLKKLGEDVVAAQKK